ncbi:L,D-transpeptidase family protein [Actinomyces minihominis]|uniref:L,D-transpeptidase family protein n=1 Tax=Actinomyces minihominis TaxID=2002838 RepID=UPI000C0725C1|nr:L,D-transpeptidase family protein [Actinomyces minihominis]
MKKLFDSKPKVITASVLGLLAIAVAIFAGVSTFYGSHGLPETRVAGESISGLTRDQVAENLRQVSDQLIVVEGDVEPVEVTLAEAGVTVDVDKTVAQAFSANSGFFTRMTALFESRDITPVVTVDEAKVAEFAGTIEGDGLTDATNGAVQFDTENLVFVAQDAKPGYTIDTQALAQSLGEAGTVLNFEPVTVVLEEVVPDFDSEAARASADRANQWLNIEVSLLDRLGVSHTADVETKAKWVVFNEDVDPVGMSLDQGLVRAWVEEHSAETNVEPEPKVQNVTAAGRVLSVSREGTDGFAANNAEALTTAILATVEAPAPFIGVVEYETEERPVQDRLIADGAENLSYAAAPGEKWIDINLSNYTVTAYEGATPVLQSPMVAGAPLTPTVTGEYSVWAKVPTQTMRGDNVDGTKYETPNVPWILYFHGGYATHGAYWRSSFGYDAGAAGSHGCVNMPVDSAKSLYDWASVGTKVLSHY